MWFFLFIMPILLLIVLFTKTTFTNSEIIHTNFILRTKRKSYEEIDYFKVTLNRDVRIYFTDRSSIKVLTGQNQLAKTLKILEEYTRSIRSV